MRVGVVVHVVRWWGCRRVRRWRHSISKTIFGCGTLLIWPSIWWALDSRVGMRCGHRPPEDTTWGSRVRMRMRVGQEAMSMTRHSCSGDHCTLRGIRRGPRIRCRLGHRWRRRWVLDMTLVAFVYRVFKISIGLTKARGVMNVSRPIGYCRTNIGSTSEGPPPRTETRCAANTFAVGLTFRGSWRRRNLDVCINVHRIISGLIIRSRGFGDILRGRWRSNTRTRRSPAMGSMSAGLRSSDGILHVCCLANGPGES